MTAVWRLSGRTQRGGKRRRVASGAPCLKKDEIAERGASGGVARFVQRGETRAGGGGLAPLRSGQILQPAACLYQQAFGFVVLPQGRECLTATFLVNNPSLRSASHTVPIPPRPMGETSV